MATLRHARGNVPDVLDIDRNTFKQRNCGFTRSCRNQHCRDDGSRSPSFFNSYRDCILGQLCHAYRLSDQHIRLRGRRLQIQ